MKKNHPISTDLSDSDQCFCEESKIRAGSPQLYQLLGAWLRAGLAEFYRSALPENTSLLSLLEAEQSKQWPESKAWAWKQINHELTVQRANGSGALAELIQNEQLNPAQIFLLMLAGEAEQSHAINLILAELQAPNRQARPSIHLCQAIQEHLFAEAQSALQLCNQGLFQRHIIQRTGNGPLPEQLLSIDMQLWSALGDMPITLQQQKFVPPGTLTLIPKSTQQQLPDLIHLWYRSLAQNPFAGFAIRGEPHSGRLNLAAQLANDLDLQAVLWTETAWQQHPCPDELCLYAAWLPVLAPDIQPDTVWQPPSIKKGLPIAFVLPTKATINQSDLINIELPLPDLEQRHELWQRYLQSNGIAKESQKSHPKEHRADRIAHLLAKTALLGAPTIQRLGKQAQQLATQRQEPLQLNHILEARQLAGSEKLRVLAQPVLRSVSREALVVPSHLDQQLDNLINRAHQREALWQGLGSTLTASITPGIRALFVGESGTGKTLAASFVATQLGAPLYRVDLSSVMNKYIGETEKNLAQLLDYAAAFDVILLFDEADALFGSRTEGRETGERYANMLTNFLLTRIENHPGIVLLTTNGRERIDTAFNRRLDLIMEFPLPGFEQRLKLWQSHLGSRAPHSAVLKSISSYCDFSGGQIRNAVINAAVASAGGPIRAQHLLDGLGFEYQKLGRSLPGNLSSILDIEIRLQKKPLSESATYA